MPPCCPEPPDVCVSGFIRLWIKVVSVYVIFLNAFFTYVLYPHSSWTTTKKCTMILPSSRPLCIWVVPHEFQPTTNVCDQLYDCLRLSLFAFYFFFFLCVVCYIFGFGSVCCCLSQSIALLWCDTPYNKCAHTHTVSDHHAHTTHTHSLTTHNTNTHLQYCATTHKHRHDTDQLFITQI